MDTRIPTTEGTHVIGEVTIEKVTTKNDWARFWIVGCEREVVLKKEDLEPNGIKEGAKINLTVNNRSKPDSDGNPRITSFLGKPQNRGGGRGYQPKSKEEIHSASICGLLKSAMEFGGKDWKPMAEQAIEVYANGLKKVIG